MLLFEYSIRQVTRLFNKPTNHEFILQKGKTFVRKPICVQYKSLITVLRACITKQNREFSARIT